jgi:hypothetical protein
MHQNRQRKLPAVDELRAKVVVSEHNGKLHVNASYYKKQANAAIKRNKEPKDIDAKSDAIQ